MRARPIRPASAEQAAPGATLAGPAELCARPSRRGLLVRASPFAAGAALGLLLGRRARVRLSVPVSPLPRPEVPRPLASRYGDDGRPALRIFAVGDIGWNSLERALVVEEMATQSRFLAPHFALLLGDNF